jgi:hypothetical protein
MEHGVASNALAENKPVDLFVKWGVAPGPAVWPVILRILFVIDGRIDTSSSPECFGLGYVLETLRDHSFAWWVRFKVQVVRRDETLLVDPQFGAGGNRAARLPNCPQQDSNYTEAGEDPKFKIFGFRFTEENFSLDDWDQVWFFGDYPDNSKADISEPQFCPLEDPELKLLTEWMDRGGGVFAAGDHWNLGASMCSRIPRVRTMRRWTQEQGVPTQDRSTRHETLQPQATGYEDVWEKDTIPQPVELVYRPRLTSILARPLLSHPLLSTPAGIINAFPDHMHEGDVVEDQLVKLDSPLNIPGYERPEYPYEQPQVDPGMAGRITSAVEWRPRPRPHVVAYGRTTNPDVPEEVGLPELARFNPGLVTKRFGLVGAYDGDRVGIGRVVVDSTWHHWFSYNLHGFKADNPSVFERMQAYYRNVGLWLATRAQRQSLLFATTWGPVVSDPMAFPPASTRSLWAVGRRAIQVMARTVSEPMLFDFVASFFRGRSEEMFGVPYEVDPADPYASSVPADLAIRAIVGGIASALIQPASEYLQAEGKPRRLLDAGAIARHAAEGVKQGHLALVDTLRSSAVASKELAGRLADAFHLSPQLPIPVDLIPLRVVAELLQLPDPTDPALVGGYRARGEGDPRRLTFTVRVTLAGLVVAYAVIDEIEVASFQLGGAFVHLDRILFEGLVQSGESLAIDVVTGTAGREGVAAERLRFNETVAGDPSSWVGPHAPSQSHPWRLWYRIEKTDGTHQRAE